MSTLICIIVLFICVIIPALLTIFNIINLFKKKKIKENFIDYTTFILGIFLTAFWYIVQDFKDYTEGLRLGGFEIEVHSPIASWSMPTVLGIFVVGLISYILIRKRKLNLPPLAIVCAMSGTVICSIYMVMFIIQISKNFDIIEVPFLAIFPINYILCSLRAQIEVIKVYKERNLEQKEYKNKILNKCSKILYDTDNWPILAIILSIPLMAILICILVLFGQRPDEAIKAFLETSDWTLSAKVSPPSVTYDAHYLCTVSLRGHKKLVRPIRMGIRHGEKIVVNRQLCVANAFEDLIQEKTPRFHHFVRYIYDKYGYPISKHINTATKADITYIVMKPLEWVFLAILYMFDIKPENRIATQYVGDKEKVWN